LDNRRLLIAAALSMAVLLAWQYLFPAPEPPAPRPAAETAARPAAASAETTTAAARPEPTAPAETAAPAPELAPVAGEEERREVLENGELRAEFTNRGGQLVSLQVRGRTAEVGGALELVAPRETTPLPLALLAADGTPLPVNQALFAVSREATPGGDSLVFTYRGELGQAEKRFTLLADGRLDFEIVAPGTSELGLVLGPGLRARTAADLASRYERRLAVWSVGGSLETLAPEKQLETEEVAGQGLDWIGLEDTYFLTAVVPAEPLARARVRPVLLDPTADEQRFEARPLPADGELSATDKKLPREFVVELYARGERLSGTSFWGAKQWDRLAALPYGLESTVRWGMFGFLARPLLWGLQWLHANVVANYGWAIVLLTAALKIVLLPLSLAAFKSMRKMQALNPKMQAVRERWRGKLRDKNGRFNSDAQRQMNEEVMALYRSEGVNPAGGCLPMLVQLPIFFAFYNLLATAVELWRSPWLGWVTDLTAPDAYYVLPIVMGISQVVQQRMTPPPPDPMQKRLMQMLPIVFTVFSLGFASGLVLYWLTNNILTIGQQLLYNSIKDHAAEPAAVPVKGGRKAK